MRIYIGQSNNYLILTKTTKKRFIHLGPEPFDNNFNLKYFLKFIKDKERTIKDLLIDQKFVSGIGNIYASEILFLSKINPMKKIKLLSGKECSQIIFNSKKVLISAIKKGGSSIRDFCDALKALGSTENIFEPVRPNDLFRDIIRKIVKILLRENIPLSLHVQSTLNKFMTELDRQLPETIFPVSNARYIEEGRIRILKDYLRGYLRTNT